MLGVWYKQTFPSKTFHSHFRLEHEFHGIVQHHISETFIIKPVSALGLQLLLDGVQISDPVLHLKSKITIRQDSIHVCFLVIDPTESKKMIQQLIKVVVKQLLAFEKRFYSNPVVHYVEPFCKRCLHYQTKPFNQCMATCSFQEKNQESAEKNLRTSYISHSKN
ncbi:hypothetical protein [Ammoniphilus sp. YIM 78166]|uniref:hypothetical protein n=1 Tax=Ammoniphilus sp. YIM 78166 TaxID=1644106 RepID=UPI00106FEA4D|nr:hypothetical protein [Ammoniphilus sp. YIM 78166]